MRERSTLCRDKRKGGGSRDRFSGSGGERVLPRGRRGSRVPTARRGRVLRSWGIPGSKIAISITNTRVSDLSAPFLAAARAGRRTSSSRFRPGVSIIASIVLSEPRARSEEFRTREEVVPTRTTYAIQLFLTTARSHRELRPSILRTAVQRSLVLAAFPLRLAIFQQMYIFSLTFEIISKAGECNRRTQC